MPWRKLAFYIAVVCGLLLAAYIGLQTAYTIDFDMTRRTAYLHIADQIGSIFGGTIDFFKPFVQVALFVALAHWAFQRFNLSAQGWSWQQLNVEKTLVLLIVGGFIFVALKGGAESLGYLKDLALVSLGFYFGWIKAPKAG